MPTAVLDAYSKSFPAITNRIRAALYLESDLSAIVASIIDTTAGHPTRIYHFTGLDRANYQFSLDEIDGSDNVIQNLALFDVVPSGISGLLTRDDEQIKVGTTTGFDAGLNVVVFDGTGGKPDYRGWNIVPSELTGRGILALGVDYSWDSVTGTMTWLQAGDVLPANQIYNIHFDPLAAAPDATPINTDFSARIVTANDNVVLSDFGNTIIVEPAGNYLELQLPDITTVPKGRLLTVEMAKVVGNSPSCCQVLRNGSDVINFNRGHIYLMSNESVQIYRFKRPDNSNEWRVRNADGNFKHLGESVGDDAVNTGVFCKHLLDGSIEDIHQYARLYNDFVLNLPSTQRCNFDDWATGNNKYLYSLANSADPDNTDKFHFPDRRGLFERNNNTGKAGDYAADTVGPHTHPIKRTRTDIVGTRYESNHMRSGSDRGLYTGDDSATSANAGTTETQPKNYLINKYILV